MKDIQFEKKRMKIHSSRVNSGFILIQEFLENNNQRLKNIIIRNQRPHHLKLVFNIKKNVIPRLIHSLRENYTRDQTKTMKFGFSGFEHL